MKFIPLIISFLFISGAVRAQGNYFATHIGDRGSSFLSMWRYELNEKDTSFSSRGTITFWRSEPVKGVRGEKDWTPNISFRIYAHADSSQYLPVLRSIQGRYGCGVGNNGGAIHKAGTYLFINTDECVQCSNVAYVNYCTEVLMNIFNAINDRSAASVQDQLQNIPLFRARLPKTLRNK